MGILDRLIEDREEDEEEKPKGLRINIGHKSKKKRRKIYPEQTKIKIWDALRKRKQIDLNAIKSKKDLINRIGKAFGLRKIEQATGKQKSVISFIQKSDFYDWLKGRYTSVISYNRRGKPIKVHVRSKPKRWNKEEINYLMKLHSHGLKGKKLAKVFKKTYTRSFSSILSKFYRIRKNIRKNIK